MHNKKLILSVGFAMFAMFFGAGNLIFPLWIGAHSANQLAAAVLGFAISGVLIPFLGLFVIALYEGDYLKFLACIGRKPAFVVALILIVLIGLVVGTPRTSVVAFGTFQSFLPASKWSFYIFNAVFFGLAYLACIRKNAVVSFLGAILSPIKITCLLALIAIGLFEFSPATSDATTAWHSFSQSLLTGYQTMDLLAAFFFCAFIYKYICFKTREQQVVNRAKITLLASLVGAGLLLLVYIGFLLVANQHAVSLDKVATQDMIGAVAKLLLPGFAASFIAVVVTLACFSTALALFAVTSDFLHDKVFNKRVHYQPILFIVALITYLMSNAGFTVLMKIAVPILNVLYPALLVLTVTNLLGRLFRREFGGCWFYLALVLAVAWQLYRCFS